MAPNSEWPGREATRQRAIESEGVALNGPGAQIQSAPQLRPLLLYSSLGTAGIRLFVAIPNVMKGVKGRSAPTVPKKEHGVPDVKKPLNEGYMKIPPSITDQFGEQFAKELYDEKKINQPANTIDVRSF